MTIVVERVNAGYGGIEVLRDVSLAVASGEILGVLGRNGMGKSTLIRTMSGLIPVTRGTIRLTVRMSPSGQSMLAPAPA